MVNYREGAGSRSVGGRDAGFSKRFLVGMGYGIKGVD